MREMGNGQWATDGRHGTTKCGIQMACRRTLTLTHAGCGANGRANSKFFSYPVKIIMRFCEIVEAGGQKQMFVLLLQFSTRRQDTHTYTHTHTCTGFDSWHPWLRWSKTFVKLVFSFLSALLCGYNSLWTTMSTLVLIIICLCDEVLMFVLVKEMRRTLRKKKYIYIYIDMVN